MKFRGGWVLLLAACGARTELGAPRDAGADAIDAPVDVAPKPDATTSACTLTAVTTLASGQSPEHLLIDDAFVYWVNEDSSVRRVPKNGGEIELLGFLPSPPEFGFALDDAFVYGGSGDIGRIPKSSGPTASVTTGDSAYGFAVDATNLYWAETGGAVRYAPKAGGAAIDLASAQGGANRVAVDATYVYYTTWAPPDGGIWRVPIAGGAAVQLATTPYADYLVLDGSDVYWSSITSQPATGGIWKLRNGADLVSLATSDLAQGVAVDDTYVYWAEGFDHISRVPKDGGATMILFPNQMNARSVAVDATCVYWSLDPIVGEIRAGPR